MQKEKYPVDKDLLAVQRAIALAEKEGLLAEVIYSTLGFLKFNPELTIEGALNKGLLDWDI